MDAYADIHLPAYISHSDRTHRPRARTNPRASARGLAQLPRQPALAQRPIDDPVLPRHQRERVPGPRRRAARAEAHHRAAADERRLDVIVPLRIRVRDLELHVAPGDAAQRELEVAADDVAAGEGAVHLEVAVRTAQRRG